MIELSYNEAMMIQRYQLLWYRSQLGWKGTKYIRGMTSRCPQDVHPDKPISIFRINELIPRGGFIENVANHRVWKKQRYTKSDPTCMYWVEAIKRGLV